jgi:glutathione reductase (NADPH)
MAEYDVDLFTIGAGSGGVRVSRMAARMGARVACAEERHLGGTCVNVGCIPKKLLVYASHYRDDLEDARRGYGWSIEGERFDWSALIAKKDAEIARLNGVYRRLLLEAGVELLEGRARVVDPHAVEIGDRRITARHIVVATGSRPHVPDIPGIEHTVTSDEVFHLEKLPRRIAILGGGFIAVEFASIFHGLGVDVADLYRGPLFLRGFDDDLRRVLAEEMRAKGIDVRFDADVVGIERTASGVRAHVHDGTSIEADLVLNATGRTALSADLGLEDVGVELRPGGAIAVDAYSGTTVPSIWAIGDVTDRRNLTPVAIHEAMCLAATLFGDEPRAPSYENVPSAVFSQPAIGTVGLTEAEARERYGAIDVYRSRFRPLRHTLTGRDETTLVKLVADRESDRVLGVHMVGPDAGEVIQGFAVALTCGATKAQFDATIGVHPTAAEELVTLREPVRD